MSQGIPKKKPVEVLLESFVLDCIGRLDPSEEQTTQYIVDRVFGASDDWRAHLREQLGLTDAVRDQLKAMWDEARTLADEKGTELDAREFAAWVVHENFTEIVEMVDASVAEERERLEKKRGW